jgi:hypothetical protein
MNNPDQMAARQIPHGTSGENQAALAYADHLLTMPVAAK